MPSAAACGWPDPQSVVYGTISARVSSSNGTVGGSDPVGLPSKSTDLQERQKEFTELTVFQRLLTEAGLVVSLTN